VDIAEGSGSEGGDEDQSISLQSPQFGSRTGFSPNITRGETENRNAPGDTNFLRQNIKRTKSEFPFKKSGNTLRFQDGDIVQLTEDM